MSRNFALTIRLHDTRYHGAQEWPPAPARVFQALVAGAAEGRHVPAGATEALTLLEVLSPPLIAAPVARRGQRASLFVPNNDLDSVGGDPERIGEVRARKAVQPYLLQSDVPFLYVWSLPERGGEELIPLAERLYQFGRGVDPAWAVGEILDDQQLAARLQAHRGTVHRPSAGEGSNELAVPTTNSLMSVRRRFEAALIRLRPRGDGQTSFFQPPKAHFAMVGYDGTPTFHLFELRDELEPARSLPWATWRATSLIEHVRDTAVLALSRALPERKAEVERVLIGRKSDGSNAGTIGERVRIIPLPSIGHRHANQSIRRVLVQIPLGPLPESDILWALSGRPLLDRETGELGRTTLAASPADDMVARYRARSRTWRSVTPLALGSARRRRIEPTRRREQAKSPAERTAEEESARKAVAQALRHAGVTAPLVSVHVQREPFDAHGTRAERFADGTRFAKETLWHVDLEFDDEIPGPLVLGDGRFLGLGVMTPKVEYGALAMGVAHGLRSDVDTTALARALRRAVMARVQEILASRGQEELPEYFHGHAGEDGADQHESTHLAFSVDVPRSRLLIIPPHILRDPARPSRWERAWLKTLETAVADFSELRAGKAGVLSLRATRLFPDDPLLRPSRRFRSVTEYIVTRHAKHSSAEETVAIDVRRECDRRGLPSPSEIRVVSVRGVSRVGVLARVELTFAAPISGPLLLGKTRHLGRGLFEAVQETLHEKTA